MPLHPAQPHLLERARGRLLALDTPRALGASLSGALYEVIVREHRRAATVLRELPGVAGVQMFGERAHVRVAGRDDRAEERMAARLGQAGLTVESIRPIPMSLEDVFIERLSEARS